MRFIRHTFADVAKALVCDLEDGRILLRASRDLDHPTGVQTTPADREFRASFEEQVRAFEQMLPELLSTRPGWFVAVSNQAVVDSDQDGVRLWRRSAEKAKHGVVLIHQVVPTGIGEVALCTLGV